MKKLLALSVALALAACGGGSDKKSPALTGKLYGQTFDPSEMVFSGPRSSDSCSFTFSGTTVAFGNSALILGFGAQSGVCALATDACAGKKSFPFVWGLVATARLGGAAQPLTTGSYTVYADITQAVPTNPLDPIRAAVFQGDRTDASCVPDANPPAATGTIRIDALSASAVSGELDLTFADGQGGFLRGPFTAVPCAGAEFDACLPAPPACTTGTPTCQ
ncbi:hypothetical protein [Anaeromyxobacter terrae]|uniref:hypothetical protein n=1 Tax=Anaeromyxobacter terrae TaxID=2925406 RepID=UPI001F5AD174|nr:hypothetical protein [Anaeromyxobacter sp. SG22]